MIVLARFEPGFPTRGAGGHFRPMNAEGEICFSYESCYRYALHQFLETCGQNLWSARSRVLYREFVGPMNMPCVIVYLTDHGANA